MKTLFVVYPKTKFYGFEIVDEKGNKVGKLEADTYVADHLPILEDLLRYDSTELKISIDSIVRLTNDIYDETHQDELGWDKRKNWYPTLCDGCIIKLKIKSRYIYVIQQKPCDYCGNVRDLVFVKFEEEKQ